ncbi:MAG: FtsX-like permease family protein [Planctomycetia bacterium]|nr:FtsX-like permease family protein [Planctomycetia bacterium]
MYKLFLCLRYLRTRCIVLASIISVMLGVGTMIVVNSVMAGFAHEMQTRIHGILGDLMVTSTSSDGFYDPEGQMQKIRDTLGDQVVGMTPICTTVGVLTYKTRVLDADGYEREAQLTEQVCVVGVDESSKASVGDFGQFLQHPENRKQLSFALREGGYDTFEGQKMRQSRGMLSKLFPNATSGKDKLRERTDMREAGWKHRKHYYGDPLPGYEIITNPELHVETKQTEASDLPTMKSAEKEEAPCLAMMDSTPSTPVSEDPMENPPVTPEMPGALGVAEMTETPKTPEGPTAQNPFHRAEELKTAENGGSLVNTGSSGNSGNTGEAGNTGNQGLTQGTRTASVPGTGTGTEVAQVTGSETTQETVSETEGMQEQGEFEDPFANPFGEPTGEAYDPLKETHPGIIVGISMAMFRNSEGEDKFYLLPGRDVMLTFPDCNIRPTGVTGHFTCVDLYESKMSEYDSQFVFVSMKTLQDLRGMPNKANQIQIQLREGADLDAACEELQKVFDPQLFICKTWRDDKMPLLQAVDMEIAVLNVLLFMIIAVSGFGILSIFYMVVSDKTRDIGILKALGASSWGVMSIFLMYGLSLGIVGAGLGLILGLLFVFNINEIADFLSRLLGHEVFPADIYYFHQIPYDISFETVAWIMGGALLIAVLASVFPARRASRLQPVESLRYE